MNKKILTTTITSSVMGAILIGALVYFNFFDDAKVNEGGKEIGDKCLVQNVTMLNSESSTWNVKNNEGKKITIINFWATYCNPCLAEIPYFEQAKNEYKDDLDIIAIHVADSKDINYFNNYVTYRWAGYNMSFGLDKGNNDSYYKRLGGNDILPMTVIVDREGYITYSQNSSVTYELLKTQIEYILQKEKTN